MNRKYEEGSASRSSLQEGSKLEDKPGSSKAGDVVGIPHTTQNAGRFYTHQDLERLRRESEVRMEGQELREIGDCLDDVTILTGSWGMPRLTSELLAKAPRLRAVCYAAGSAKGFVTREAFQRDIIITSAKAANAIPVAEVTIALITLANKRWFQCLDDIRSRGRDGWRDPDEPSHIGNFRAVVGLIGFGAIGREVAFRLREMSVEVLVYDPYVDDGTIGAAGAEKVDMRDLGKRSDVVSLHAPDIPECEGMIDAKFLSVMKDGATLINTARGRLVHEADLVAELEKGRIYAMLDVVHPEPPEANHPFYGLPNCWLSPHRSGSSGMELRRMGQYAVDECLRILRGEAPRYRVYEDSLSRTA